MHHNGSAYDSLHIFINNFGDQWHTAGQYLKEFSQVSAVSDFLKIQNFLY